MTNKVLSIALAVVLLALPLPANQLLAASAPLPPAPTASVVSQMLADPFLVNQLSFEKPSDLKTLVAAQL
ncbi:MAG: hypothetical protein ABL866_02685 [Devosia sp.]